MYTSIVTFLLHLSEYLFSLLRKGVIGMFPNIGMPGLILIFIIALVIFGPNRLPDLGKAVGRTLKEFKSATKEIIDDEPTTK